MTKEEVFEMLKCSKDFNFTKGTNLKLAEFIVSIAPKVVASSRPPLPKRMSAADREHYERIAPCPDDLYTFEHRMADKLKELDEVQNRTDAEREKRRKQEREDLRDHVLERLIEALIKVANTHM